MDWSLLLFGLTVGVIVAAPIGPVNLICIQRTLAAGRLQGFLAGMGAVAGDGVFALIAAIGVGAAGAAIGVSEAGASRIGAGLEIAGGGLLIAIGLATARARPKGREAAQARASFFGGFATTFALTVTNPATMFGFAALFTAHGGLERLSEDPRAIALVTLAVMGGSAAWWAALASLVDRARAHISEAWTLRINRVCGGLLIGFGVFVIASALV